MFLGAQWITKTGLFKVPGVVYYDDSLEEDEKELLSNIFTEEVVLDEDVTIAAEYSLERPKSEEGVYIYNIYVPVVDYYSTDSNIEVDHAENVFADAYQREVDYEMVPVDELDYTKKLISLNGSYYLDEFDKGAVYRVISFKSEKFADEILPLVDGKLAREYPSKDSVLTFAQTGVTCQ